LRAVAGRRLIVVHDEHNIFTNTFAQLLREEYDIISVADDEDGFLENVRRFQPDVVIAAFTGSSRGGLSVLRDIYLVSPASRTLVITACEDASVAAEAFRLGASAYVLQKCPPSELLRAMRATHKQLRLAAAAPPV
jgi:DNA-binding NarL/FixJ family response regulator